MRLSRVNWRGNKSNSSCIQTKELSPGKALQDTEYIFYVSSIYTPPFVRFGSDIWDWLLSVPCPITQTLTSTIRFVPGVLDKFCYFSISPFKAIHTISHGLPVNLPIRLDVHRYLFVLHVLVYLATNIRYSVFGCRVLHIFLCVSSAEALLDHGRLEISIPRWPWLDSLVVILICDCPMWLAIYM